MAIQKLTAMTSTDMTPLLTILQEHAVPTYFDSVTLAEDGTYISCFCGDTEFIRIYQNLGTNATSPTTSTGSGVIITTATGAVQAISLVFASSNSFTAAVCICESGIALLPNGMAHCFGLICKDTDENTCFYTLSTLNGNNWGNSTGLPSTETNCNIWAISCADTEIRSYNSYLNNADNTTGKMLGMPIITAEHRLRDVWFPAIRQLTEITEPIEVEIDEGKYMINRGFIAKSE